MPNRIVARPLVLLLSAALFGGVAAVETRAFAADTQLRGVVPGDHPVPTEQRQQFKLRDAGDRANTRIYRRLIAADNACADLVRRTCGAENQCSTAPGCAPATRLLLRYNGASGNDRREAELSCVGALEDSAIFIACGD